MRLIGWDSEGLFTSELPCVAVMLLAVMEGSLERGRGCVYRPCNFRCVGGNGREKQPQVILGQLRGGPWMAIKREPTMNAAPKARWAAVWRWRKSNVTFDRDHAWSRSRSRSRFRPRKEPRRRLGGFFLRRPASRTLTLVAAAASPPTWHMRIHSGQHRGGGILASPPLASQPWVI